MLGATVALFLAAMNGSLVLTMLESAADGTAAGIAALLIAIQAAVGYALHRALRDATGTRRPRLYRFAFLGACGMTILTMALTAQVPGQLRAGVLLAVTIGSLIGAVVASSRDYGLWEDNYPPSPAVRETVRQVHADRLIPGHRAPLGKAVFDRVGGLVGVVLLSPLAAVIAVALWLEDPGPLLFAKNSVGRFGSNFRQWKFRTMHRGAEVESGPVWAEREDQRVLRAGVVLRKTALDELPQLFNIAIGQMSFVGPRPQRTVLVAKVLERMPEYAERHRLAPGLAGLAQVAGHYYLTPRQKLRFDRLYIRYASLGFDLRLLLIAFAVVFWLRWRPGWNGRLPRPWLHPRDRRHRP
jgi:lipopolysaccharide/colanic/teichoic acid biosynthesis glycosyltransferase